MKSVLNELSIKNLKLNKKRSAVIIIGIILSTALICGVAGLVTSTQASIIRQVKLAEGDYHTVFYNVPKEEIVNIKDDDNISKCYLAEEIGYSYLEDSKNEYKPYLALVAANKEYMNNMGIQLKEGRLPENDKEIVISEHINKNGKVSYSIGEKISLNICDRLDKKGKKLTQQDSFNKTIEEQLIEKFTKEYTIVGIIYRPSYATEKHSSPGYTIMTHMDDISNNANVAATFKNTEEYKQEIERLAGLLNTGEKEQTIRIPGLGFYDTKKYDIRINDELLRYEGAALSANTNQMLYGLATVIIGIILVSSVFVIKNGFAISVTERLKQYGMLASVGTTKKQIKKSVYFEGLVLGLIRNTTWDNFWNSCNNYIA